LTNVQGAKKHRHDVITEPEFQAALSNAELVDSHPYYRLRDKAILCILWLTGKRAGEVAALELDDVEQERGLLRITFSVLKKRETGRPHRRTKAVPVTDPYTEPIIRYHGYMVSRYPDCRYLFPTTTYSNLTGQVIIDNSRHLHVTSIWRRVVLHGPETWTHLYRETQGAKVVRAQRNQIAGLFAVKQRLDLERLDTAMRYVQRYGVDLIEEPQM